MNVFTKLKRIFIILLLISIVTPSCRDDIYDPNGSESNVNEPLVTNNPDSFSFILNAKNITYYVVNKTRLSDPYTSLSINVDKYKSGYASISISDTVLNASFYVTMDSSNTNVATKLTNYIPERVAIQFHNFTGKLNILLTSAYYY